MLSGKKNPVAALIVAKMPKNMSENRDIHENETPQDDYTEVSREILSAIASKDAAMLADSLKSFYKICEQDEAPDEETSEGEQ